jgi:hypothetical protein
MSHKKNNIDGINIRAKNDISMMKNNVLKYKNEIRYEIFTEFRHDHFQNKISTQTTLTKNKWSLRHHSKIFKNGKISSLDTGEFRVKQHVPTFHFLSSFLLSFLSKVAAFISENIFTFEFGFFQVMFALSTRKKKLHHFVWQIYIGSQGRNSVTSIQNN